MGTFSIASTLDTLWTGSWFDVDKIERAAETARQRGKTPFLHIEVQELWNNGVEDPSRPFRHDWRMTTGKSVSAEIKPGWAGSRNALAICLIKGKIHADDGTVAYPCFFAVSCSPDGYDCD